MGSHCDDGSKDADESDVDCGGATCIRCAVGQRCGATTDCGPGNGCNVTSRVCDADLCHDGVFDGNETGVDCGGSTCPGCGVGSRCNGNADCLSGEGCDVSTRTCDANLCRDGVRNDAETDVDCGGGTCSTCALGKGCALSRDCSTTFCNATTNQCVATHCSDAIKNGDETGVDCGGPTCGQCPVGQGCSAVADCSSGYCNSSSHLCVTQCGDGARNGGETDVDCGGPTCAACLDGKQCSIATDCGSGVCSLTLGVCQGSTCSDGVKNGSETDVDCGGSCGGCSNGQRCASGSDCSSTWCAGHPASSGGDAGVGDASPDSEVGVGDAGSAKDAGGDAGSGGGGGGGKCVASQCMDGTKNGVETDVDCGGGTCRKCAGQMACAADSDCISGACNSSTKLCAGSWSVVATGIPAGSRMSYAEAWSGSSILMYGSSNDPVSGTAAVGWSYQLGTGTYASLPMTGAPSFSGGPGQFAATFAGGKMVVMAGMGTPTGGTYDPATRTWATLTAPSCLMGGATLRLLPIGSKVYAFSDMTAGVLDPAASSWSCPTGAPFMSLYGPFGAWTGSEAIVASPFSARGEAYNVATGGYRTLSWTGGPSGLYPYDVESSFAGGKLVMLTDTTDSTYRTGVTYLYDPATDAWSHASAAGAPAPMGGGAAVTDGVRAFFFDGTSGGVYSPSSDSWAPMDMTGAPSVTNTSFVFWYNSKIYVMAPNDPTQLYVYAGG